MRAIYIGYKISLDSFYPIWFQCFCYHIRSQVAAANTNIDDVFDFFAGITFPLTTVHLFTKAFICSCTLCTSCITSLPAV